MDQRRRRSVSKARTTVLCGLLFFLGGQALGSLALERLRPELRDPEYGGKLAALKARQAERPGQPLVLGLGSSRCAMGFRPDLVVEEWPAGEPAPVVFNFSLVGAGPLMELFCLRRLLADGVRPDHVLVECWPPFLHQEGPHAEEFRIDVNRVRWGDLPLLSRYSQQPRRLYQRWTEARLIPGFCHRFILMSQFAPNWLMYNTRLDGHWRNLDAWGWLPNPHATKDEAVQRRNRLESARQYYGPILDAYRISPSADRALHELVELCRREGIPVTVFVMPDSNAFRSWCTPAVQRRMDAYIQGLGQDWGLPVVDGRTWVADEDFSDGFHLLPSGAARFTRRLGRELIQPVLAQHKMAR